MENRGLLSVATKVSIDMLFCWHSHTTSPMKRARRWYTVVSGLTIFGQIVCLDLRSFALLVPSY